MDDVQSRYKMVVDVQIDVSLSVLVVALNTAVIAVRIRAIARVDSCVKQIPLPR